MFSRLLIFGYDRYPKRVGDVFTLGNERFVGTSSYMHRYAMTTVSSVNRVRHRTRNGRPKGASSAPEVCSKHTCSLSVVTIRCSSHYNTLLHIRIHQLAISVHQAKLPFLETGNAVNGRALSVRPRHNPDLGRLSLPGHLWDRKNIPDQS